MLGLILFGVGQACARRVNVNRFSLNGLYRNRLSRAFLGGAREDRKNTVNPFSGFDPEDNSRMASLRHPGQPPSPRLLHVVNVALNLVGGERLAWQERKAASFTITPLACGSAELSHTGRPSPDEPPKGAYIPTETYGGNEPDCSSKELGISLATAMTISGAAASPSMG